MIAGAAYHRASSMRLSPLASVDLVPDNFPTVYFGVVHLYTFFFPGIFWLRGVPLPLVRHYLVRAIAVRYTNVV